MKFARYGKECLQRREVTNRRIAAAKRSIKADREKNALTPELVRYQTPEERLDDFDRAGVIDGQRMRDYTASEWRKGRRYYRELTPEQQASFMNYWNNHWGGPVTSTYFVSMLHSITVGQFCPEETMKELARIRELGRKRKEKYDKTNSKSIRQLRRKSIA